MLQHRYIKNVVSLDLDTQRCTGCRQCTQVCPQAVLEMKNRKVVIVDSDACMECGACAKNCPVNAITVQAGVGCAGAIIVGALTGKEPLCDGKTSQTASPGCG